MPQPGLGYEWQQLCKRAKRAYAPICHLCQQAIDLTLKGPHPRSWSLDHLDPRATHGHALPSIDRVRPAHFGCNSRRGSQQGTVARVLQRTPSRDW